MRRTFALQMWPGADAACEMPGDCGETCHCGEAMDGHGMSDPPHTPTPMLCWACSAKEKAWELKTFGAPFPPLGQDPDQDELQWLECPKCAGTNSPKRATCRHCQMMLNPHLTFPERARSVPRANDAWHACERKGCRTAIPPERRLCLDHMPGMKL